MKNDGVRKAASHLADAKKKATALKDATNLKTAERLWGEFVECFVKFRNKLRAGARGDVSSDQWVKRVEAQISSDPILNYILQSRNAQEHTLQDLSALEPYKLSIGSPGETVHVKRLEIRNGQITSLMLGQPNVTITERKAHLRLLDVTNCGRVYPVPVSDGGDIEAAPSAFCDVAITFCEKTLSEAKRRVR